MLSVKGTKKVSQLSSGNKTQITILGCASATGQVIPPMVVFTGKYFNSLLSNGEVPDTLYGGSKQILKHKRNEIQAYYTNTGKSRLYMQNIVKYVHTCIHMFN